MEMGELILVIYVVVGIPSLVVFLLSLDKIIKRIKKQFRGGG